MQEQRQDGLVQMGGAVPEPRAIGGLDLWDGRGVRYSCRAFSIRADLRPSLAVFAFSRLDGILPQPVFIGAATEWPLRLLRHPMHEAALRLGAIHVLVHRPDPGDPVRPRDAAERLIAWYRPMLNLHPDPGALIPVS